MPRGRKREFDRANALALAGETFWEKGYEGTGLADLLDVMGIARQSLYSTYGDKHSLFLEALDDYFNRYRQPMIDRLQNEAQGLDGIETFFQTLVISSQRKKRGCLITNTITELTPKDKKVTKLVRGYIRLINQAFKDAVVEGQQMGQVRKDMSADSVCEVLSTLMQGTLVSVKVVGSNADVHSMVRSTLTTLRPPK